ncbi:MAG: flagellar basal-body rod protein FlgF [OCS116 cluster bacterium]|uniref:Flagellar basal-body rod protein FlgF n=1 Tax=OCS116 cluster bacterium TaxID=2030921 RepID=A0A2A4Z1B0_9PROT|nr:flagellar basal-body rod protein FlgF [OCS116 cluster bacterium]
MNNAIRIGLSQQVALKRQLNTVANNLANMNTAGFKVENLIMQEYIMPGASMPGHSAGSNYLSYVADTGLKRDFTTGPMQTTDNPLDVAINGEGWFTIETPNGDRYTRDGHFSLDADGQLVTISGFPVMVNGETIRFEPGEIDISIAKDGMVSTNQGERGRLDISVFNNQHLLQKDGANLFSSPERAQRPDNVMVAQGVIEKSNVNPVLQITKMIEVQRAYERSANMIEKMSELKTSSINKLAQVN